MGTSDPAFKGYAGKIAYVDLSLRQVRVEEADPRIYRAYVGGRGVQARLIHEHLKRVGMLRNPLAPENRIILGTGPLNDTAVPTAGFGSCSFIGPMTHSPEAAAWVPGHRPVYGLITHSGAGGLFPNMLKRTGLDHLVIDGRAERPVRLLVTEEGVRILDAEEALFETTANRKTVLPASAITDILTARHPGSSTLCLGPAGWNEIAFASLTGDYFRAYGGGAGAVFGSKQLVAVTAFGGKAMPYADLEAFRNLAREIDGRVQALVEDPKETASFSPALGTTWWLDRAFSGKYLGRAGGYLSWHNFDEGWFDPTLFARAGTDAFREFSGKPHLCNRCRHLQCTRSAKVPSGPYAGDGLRPGFETAAGCINCCVTDRDAIFQVHKLAGELGVDAGAFTCVAAGAMELQEKGFLRGWKGAPRFGDADSLIQFLKAVAYRGNETGTIFARPSDAVIAAVASRTKAAGAADIARSVVTAYGGLGYAGVQPKAFPGMFAAFGTSARGRGDFSSACPVPAEEGGTAGAGDLAAFIAGAQAGKALLDSLGLCDAFPEDGVAELFPELLRALTGIEYTAEALKACAARITTLERHINNFQGRFRPYDAYIPPKLASPLTAGPLKGRAADEKVHRSILDAYYRLQGWTQDGIVRETRLLALDIV